MIDTHCHLSHEAFENDIDEVVVRAVATGVRAALTLTEERADMPLVLELKARYPEWINVGFGIHPLQVSLLCSRNGFFTEHFCVLWQLSYHRFFDHSRINTHG
ncbi:hypothetical protein AHF37_06725 [Paragonimus kellicotti]|nr:hypothetical protein AHF37_06725 [Paragonimus kellicotti]